MRVSEKLAVIMGGIWQAEKVVKVIFFLVSDESSLTTGAQVTVDGGMAHV